VLVLPEIRLLSLTLQLLDGMFFSSDVKDSPYSEEFFYSGSDNLRLHRLLLLSLFPPCRK
jgi:hypothetical protein